MLNMKARPIALLILATSFLLAGPSSGLAREQDKEALLQEEREDYYKKWLKEDVVYIITEQEKSVFQKLTTPEEKDKFIEQFWRRRDSDPMSAYNEYKEEHYRRIAYANERFASGKPGWKTDRGKIYITWGPPAQIESHSGASPYQRPVYEGGGVTLTHPFERWRYRYVEGVGSDVELEFVDKTLTGEYRLALDPWEKDALLNTPVGGETFSESMGMSLKTQRLQYYDMEIPGDRFRVRRAKDEFFERLRTHVGVQQPKPIKYWDLKQIVDVNISFSDFPFRVRQDYFKFNEDQVVVPITLEFENKNLTFKKENGIHVSNTAVYGMITSMTQRLVQEFDDEVRLSYKPEGLQAGLQRTSLHQKIVILDRKMRYKLDLVVKDLNSDRTGTIRMAILPPRYDEESLSTSSIILSNYIQLLGDVQVEDQKFLLGDVIIYPNPSETFAPDNPLVAYLQLYNVGLDQATLQPSLRVNYQILQDGSPVADLVDESGESIHYYSGQRIVLIKRLPVESLSPGQYGLQVQVHDKINDKSISTKQRFQVEGPALQAANR